VVPWIFSRPSRGFRRAEKVTAVIDRRYELAETAEALRYVGEGHAQGKVVIVVDGGGARAAVS
jgi:hypothetical protein